MSLVYVAGGGCGCLNTLEREETVLKKLANIFPGGNS